MLIGFVWLAGFSIQAGEGNDYGKLLSKAKWYELADEPDSARFYYQKALKITNTIDSLIWVQLSIADQYIKQDSLTRAEFIFNQADKLIAQTFLVNNSIIMRRVHVLAKILNKKGLKDTAHELLEKVIDTTVSSGMSEARLLVNLMNYNGIVYLDQNKGDQALSFFRKAKLVCIKYGIEGIDYADVIENIGIVKANKSEFDSADYYFHLSKDIREALYETGDQRLKSFYLNYAYFMHLLNDVETSLKYNKLAESLFLKQSNPNQGIYARLLLNIGNNYYLQNDFDKAAVYYRNAINAFTQANSEISLVTLAKNNLALVNILGGNYEEAIKLLLEINGYELSVSTKAKVLKNLAKAYAGLGLFNEAYNFYNNYLLHVNTHFGAKSGESAVANIDFADFLMGRLAFARAVDHLEMAEKIYESKSNVKVDLISIYRNLAVCHFRNGDFHLAEGVFHRTEKFISELEDTGKITERKGSMLHIRVTDYYLSRAEFFLSRFKVWQDKKDLYHALEDYQKAFAMVDDMSLALTDESKLRFNENLRVHYQNAVEVAYLLYEKNADIRYAQAAFDYTARSKAVLLMTTLRENQSITTGVPNSVAMAERRINTEILYLRKAVSDEQAKSTANQSRIAFLEKKQFQLLHKYDSLLRHIEMVYPAYYALRFKPTMSDVEAVQANLQHDELMIEYLLSDSVYYIFGISPTTFIFKKLENQKLLTETANLFRNDYVQILPNHSRNDFERYINNASKLYQLLIQPVEDQIDNKRLVIVPDGLLGYIPFEILLPVNDPAMLADTAGGYANLPYLFLDHPVSYVYTSGMRLIKPSNKGGYSKGFLGMAPSYETISSVILDSLGVGLNKLPFAQEETKQATHFWKGDMLLASDATKGRFLSKAADYQLIHLAMHGLIDDENPLYSKLVFQPTHSVKESILETFELYSLKLNADLVVLSACNTGSGKLRLSEGIMSLSRGFLFAGVPSIVMTGWEVNDQSGNELTKKFYHFLQAGDSKDVALQKAKAGFLSESNMLKSHPFFWASYMVVGDNSPVVFSPGSKFSTKSILHFSILLFVLLVVVLTAICYRKKRKSKKY